jgi:hypothetical protein
LIVMHLLVRFRVSVHLNVSYILVLSAFPMRKTQRHVIWCVVRLDDEIKLNRFMEFSLCHEVVTFGVSS